MNRTFKVTFYQELIGDNGHCRSMPLDVQLVTDEADRDKALAAAMRRFETLKGLRVWSNLATHYDVTELTAQTPES